LGLSTEGVEVTYDPSKLFFTDCETTGLDPRRCDAWEIAWITHDGNEWVEEVRRIWPPALQDADTVALSINHFYERTALVRDAATGKWDDPRYVAEELAYATAGRHLVGACPWFDAGFYEKLMLANGFTPAWHYHMIDVEALAVGHLAAQSAGTTYPTALELPLPWKSDWLAEQLRLERPPKDHRHTALGDTREVKATFEHIMGTWDGSPTNP
jgi:DNA polymerase III epsilon subunit-like protein